MIRRPANFSEVSHLYGEEHDAAQCGFCKEGITTEMNPEDVFRFSLGREVTGDELFRRIAGGRLTDFAKRHVAKHGGTMPEALQVAYKLNPDWVKVYLGLDFPGHRHP